MSHCQVIKSRRIRWAGDESDTYKVVVGKPKRGRLLGRPRHGGEENNKLDFQEVGWGPWTGLIWLRIGTDGGLLRMHFQGSIKCGKFIF